MSITAASGNATTLTALRGVLMVVVALIALIYPTRTVQLLVLAGGGLLLVDGALGFMTMRRLPADSANRWIGLARNGLSMLAGVVVLFSPVLLGFATVRFLTTFVGLLAVLVGVAELAAGYQDQSLQKRLWPVLVGGAIYVGFGLALMFLPLSAATLLIRLAAVAAIAYGGLLLYRWWQARQQPTFA